VLVVVLVVVVDVVVGVVVVAVVGVAVAAVAVQSTSFHAPNNNSKRTANAGQLLKLQNVTLI